MGKNKYKFKKRELKRIMKKVIDIKNKEKTKGIQRIGNEQKKCKIFES